PISLIEIAEGSKDRIRSAAYTAPFATIFTVLVLWVPNTTGVGENVTVVLVGNGFTIGPVGGAAGAAAVAARAAALTGVAGVEGAGGKPVAPISIGAATDVRNRGKFTEPTFSPRRFTSLRSNMRTMCGVSMMMTSVWSRVLFSCAKKYFRNGMSFSPDMPIHD